MMKSHDERIAGLVILNCTNNNHNNNDNNGKPNQWMHDKRSGMFPCLPFSFFQRLDARPTDRPPSRSIELPPMGFGQVNERINDMGVSLFRWLRPGGGGGTQSVTFHSIPFYFSGIAKPSRMRDSFRFLSFDFFP
jgi:hypothetical protein